MARPKLRKRLKRSCTNVSLNQAFRLMLAAAAELRYVPRTEAGSSVREIDLPAVWRWGAVSEDVPNELQCGRDRHRVAVGVLVLMPDSHQADTRRSCAPAPAARSSSGMLIAGKLRAKRVRSASDSRSALMAAPRRIVSWRNASNRA